MKYMGLVTSCVAAATLSCCLSAHAQLDQLKKWGKKAADKATQPKDSNANDNKPAADSSTGTTTSTSSAPAASSSAAPTTTTAANSPSINGQPDLKAAKIEFVPGEKTMFMDDFSDMAADEPPPHWRVRNGAIELRTGGNLRQLTMKLPGQHRAALRQLLLAQKLHHRD